MRTKSSSVQEAAVSTRISWFFEDFFFAVLSSLSLCLHVLSPSGVLCLLEHDEEYVFTLPCAYARSILTVPWVELGGKVSINCVKSGYSATVTFHTKPFYGGKVHRWAALFVPAHCALLYTHLTLAGDNMHKLHFLFPSIHLAKCTLEQYNRDICDSLVIMWWRLLPDNSCFNTVC